MIILTILSPPVFPPLLSSLSFLLFFFFIHLYSLFHLSFSFPVSLTSLLLDSTHSLFIYMSLLTVSPPSLLQTYLSFISLSSRPLFPYPRLLYYLSFSPFLLSSTLSTPSFSSFPSTYSFSHFISSLSLCSYLRRTTSISV